ncbi:MAG TPA: RES family NAD+ phosphorylase [Chitinophagaceae bacterium]|nr:RES family NAD+ phosphorylase [Chitinophagaceae bacterium]
MEAFRLSREKFAGTPWGMGAALKGARWNSVGIEMIYTAANRSLAMAEVAVHFTLATLPDDYVMVTLFVPDDISAFQLETTRLPPDWNAWPHSLSTQAIGDQFIAENKYAVLRVPSAVTQGDFNLLINPSHPDFLRIQIVHTKKFPFDLRIFK